MIIFDSCVWVAYINHNDSQHKRAIKIFEALDGSRETYLLPEYVVLETYTVLLTRNGKSLADSFLFSIQDNSSIQIAITDEPFFLHVTRTCQAQKHNGLSFTDTALAILSKEHTVVTFDKLLQKALV